MTLPISATVQSPRAYDLVNLSGLQMAARFATDASATMRSRLRQAQQDAAYAFAIHPAETDFGLTESDLRFGWGFGNVHRYGAVGDDATDDIAAFNTAKDVVESVGGAMYFEPSQYRLTAELQLSSGIALIGCGQIKGAVAARQGVTSFRGDHTGRSVISLQGCIGITLEQINIESAVGNVPKCGLLLGRSSAASAGYHKLLNIGVYGYFTKAAIYSIASEDNTWLNPNVNLYGGGAKYCLYTSISDSLAVGGSLVTSSNLDNVFYHPFFINGSTDADAACIFLQGAEAVGSWSFIGTYLTPFCGAYVQIDIGSIDALDSLGPFTFLGLSGEILSGGDPIWGYRLTVTGANRTLRGLQIGGGRFAFNAAIGAIAATDTLVGGTVYTTGTYTNVPLTGGTGTGAKATITVAGGAVTSVTVTTIGYAYTDNDTLSAAAANIGGTGSGFSVKVNGIVHYQIYQDPALFLESPDIHIQPPEAFPYALCSLNRANIKSGNVIVGRTAEWAAITLAGSWVNAFGSPYAQASYKLDGAGMVSCKGSIQSGSGTIFTLPTDYRPVENTFITIGSNVLLITASTGVVSLSSGSGQVDLTGLRFYVN